MYLLIPPQQWGRASTYIIVRIWMMEVLALPSPCLDAVSSALLFSALGVQLRVRVLRARFLSQGLEKQGLLTKPGKVCVVRNTQWCFIPGLSCENFYMKGFAPVCCC